jgi:hypothetical protein
MVSENRHEQANGIQGVWQREFAGAAVEGGRILCLPTHMAQVNVVAQRARRAVPLLID